MYAQMFPGMEWIPVIVLALAVVFVCVVVGGSILVSRLLPFKSVRPEVARNARRGVVALVAVPILLLAVKSCAPLGGPDPRQQIAVGMSADKVRATLGKPHEQHTDAKGNETWIYYRDWAGMGYYLVRINPDGQVDAQWLEADFAVAGEKRAGRAVELAEVQSDNRTHRRGLLIQKDRSKSATISLLYENTSGNRPTTYMNSLGFPASGGLIPAVRIDLGFFQTTGKPRRSQQ